MKGGRWGGESGEKGVGVGVRMEAGMGTGAEKDTAEGVMGTRLLTMLSLGGGCFDDSLLFRFEVV